MPYLLQYDGEKLVTEAATVSEAIQAGEKAELGCGPITLAGIGGV